MIITDGEIEISKESTFPQGDKREYTDPVRSLKAYKATQVSLLTCEEYAVSLSQTKTSSKSSGMQPGERPALMAQLDPSVCHHGARWNFWH